MSRHEEEPTPPDQEPHGSASEWMVWAQKRIHYLKEDVQALSESRGKVHMDYLTATAEAEKLKKEAAELRLQLKSLEDVIANRKGIETLDPGDEVLVDNKVRGRIEAAIIGREGVISYLVSWWDHLHEQQARFHSDRVRIEPLNPTPGSTR